MNILAIDTASACCSVALRIGDKCLQRELVTTTGHSAALLGLGRELLEETRMSLRELDLLAVDIGPGSFTGLRIGIGVAQGLAYGAGLPVKGVLSLAALSHVDEQGPVISTLDARMDQVYWGIYENGREMMEPAVDSPEDLAMALSRISWTATPRVNGDGWTTYAHRLPDTLCSEPVRHCGQSFPRAEQVAALAADLSTGSGESPLRLTACYVRNRVAEKSKTT